ncbi:MAG: D-alanyl-D-alanine carboxypeptidase [Coriobacteriales bacterium]|nr:D-alanyl-D-alanine carboxypeptidase [Coriobacteriales bacterium]MBQ6586570.1 D-alanyl-D-alanine carboxypeptidase [Coriobacteriales bacterium]
MSKQRHEACADDRRLSGPGRVFRLLLAALISCVMLCPVSAFASISGQDVIGNDTIEGWGLSVTECPDINCEAGILVAADGTVLWSRNADDQRAIASITKIMTAIVALENASVDDEITIPYAAEVVGESSAGLRSGNTTTLGNLLYGLMLSSGNDAAVAIAIGVGGDQGTFVDMMNAKAEELGMTSTHFANPHGLDADGHYSSARDVAIMAQYAMNKQEFRDIVCLSTADVDLGAGTVTLRSTNSLLGIFDGCIGIKTGFTDPAGYCLCSAANRDGLELYSVILGSSTADTRFSASWALLDWGYRHYIPVQLSDTETTIALVPSLDWIDRSIPVAADRESSTYVLDYNGPVSQYISLVDVHGKVQVGDVLGTITWTQDGKVIGTAQLIAQDSLEPPGFFKRFEIWFKRTFKGETHETAQVLAAPPEIQSPSSN